MNSYTKIDGGGNIVIAHSTVTINSGSDVAEKIAQLRQEILETVDDSMKQKQSLEIVDAIEQELNSDSPKLSVLKPLINALPGVGSIASIGSFLLSLIQG